MPQRRTHKRRRNHGTKRSKKSYRVHKSRKIRRGGWPSLGSLKAMASSAAAKVSNTTSKVVTPNSIVNNSADLKDEQDKYNELIGKYNDLYKKYSEKLIPNIDAMNTVYFDLKIEFDSYKIKELFDYLKNINKFTDVNIINTNLRKIIDPKNAETQLQIEYNNIKKFIIDKNIKIDMENKAVISTNKPIYGVNTEGTIQQNNDDIILLIKNAILDFYIRKTTFNRDTFKQMLEIYLFIKENPIKYINDKPIKNFTENIVKIINKLIITINNYPDTYNDNFKTINVFHGNNADSLNMGLIKQNGIMRLIISDEEIEKLWEEITKKYFYTQYTKYIEIKKLISTKLKIENNLETTP